MTGRQLPVIQAGQGAPPVFERIAIVGLGLIGGSVALAARALWPQALVIAVDRKDVLEQAMLRHAVDVAADDLVVVAEADLVVLAAPARQNLERLIQLADAIPGEAVVTDVTSTKRAIDEVARQLPSRFTFVGGHPMAGAAVGGFTHARPDLFRGRPWLFTPGGDVPTATVDRLFQFVSAMGAVPGCMTAAAHDHLLASVSHLPQLTASALLSVVGTHAGSEGLALAGRGLVDTTRLASSPADVWRDICATNADEIGPALDALIATLQALRADLSDGARLTTVFEDASRWRADLMRGREV